MNPHALMILAEEPGAMFGAGAAVSAGLGLIVFFIKRAVTSGDVERKQLTDLTKDFAKLEMKVDASWRNIDELKGDVKELREKVYK